MRSVCLLVLFVVLSNAQWQNGSPLSVPRSELASVSVGDKVYVSGGCEQYTCVEVNNNSTDSDDPNGNNNNFNCECSQVSSLFELFDFQVGEGGGWGRLNEMPVGRYGHSAIYVQGQIWIIGGRQANGSPVRRVDIFDVVAASWVSTVNSKIPPLPVSHATYDGAAVLLDLNVVYYFGGFLANGTAMKESLRIISADTNPIWTNDQVPPMKAARGSFCAVGLPDRSLLIFGGYTKDGCDATSEAELYSANTNTWSVIPVPSIVTARAGAACLVQDRDVFIYGGEQTACGSSPVILDSVVSYNSNPVIDKWFVLPSLNSPRSRFGIAQTVNGSITTFGGVTSFDEETGLFVVSNSVEIYEDPDLADSSRSRGLSGYFAALIGLAAIFVCCSVCLIIAFKACPDYMPSKRKALVTRKSATSEEMEVLA